MANSPHVTVVILNWNGIPDLIPCLETVFASDYPHFSVIMVDNKSTDESVKLVSTRFPQVNIIQHTHNAGYAAGNNLGIAQALASGADYIMLLNNDTEISPNMISTLVTTVDDNRHIGVASPKIYLHDDPQRLWAIGGQFASLKVQTVGANMLDAEAQVPDALDFVFGCCMFIRRTVIEAIGVLDEDFRFYYEDIDFCLRAKYAHYKIAWVPEALMWHKSSLETQISSAFKAYQYQRSRILFFCKHVHPPIEKARFFLKEAPYIVTTIGRRVRRGHHKAAWWHMIGSITGGFLGLIDQRHSKMNISK